MSVSAVDVRDWRAAAAILAVVLMVSCSLVACSEKKTEPTPDAVVLLQAVAPADPAEASIAAGDQALEQSILGDSARVGRIADGNCGE